jgi:Zn-dependent peptidase ImmA (M78 family)
MTRVAVKPELLRWARGRAGVSVDTLVSKFPKVNEWEREEVQPTLRQLEAFAKATLTPVGYFFLPEPPDDRLPIPDFRTVRDQRIRRPSPNLLETVQVLQRRQSWMREFLVEDGEPRLDFVGSAARMQGDAVRAAGDMRRVLGIDAGWGQLQRTWTEALRALRVAAEAAGLFVVTNGIVGNNTHRKLDPNEFRGFVLVDDYAPFVFINGADGKAAQMFTLAHELAHVWFGQSGVFDLRDLQPAEHDVERVCNGVAAEFLVPALDLRGVWPDARRASEPFQVLARHFKVSAIVAARRALDLGLITKRAFLEFYRTYQEDERRRATTKSEGGDFYVTQDVRLGRRFARAVVRAAKEGRLLYRDAYQLTGLHGATFDRYAKGLESSR